VFLRASRRRRRKFRVCIYTGKGQGACREHAAAVVSLLQEPQRTLQLSVASIPEVHLGSLDGNDTEEEEFQ